jgi:hypothetical protein
MRRSRDLIGRIFRRGRAAIRKTTAESSIDLNVYVRIEAGRPAVHLSSMHLMTLVEILEQEIGCSTSERSKLADLVAERACHERTAPPTTDGRRESRNTCGLAKPGR